MPRSAARLLTVAIVLLGAVACQSADASPSRTASPPDRPLRWLAAGDSYSSGEGLPVVDVGEEQCQRAQNGANDAAKAWAPAALDLVNASNAGIEVAEFRFNACTGATTSDFVSGGNGRPTQWDGQTRYDLVTFSFGGNDVGFSSIVYRCLGLSVEGAAAAATGALSGASRGPAGAVTNAVASWRTRSGCPPEADMRAAVDVIAEPYRGFLKSVASDAVNAGGHVVVVGYPNLVEDPQFWPALTWFGLNTCQGIRREDALRLRGVAGHLNATIGQAVADMDEERPNGVRFTFVDINTGDDDHGVPLDDQDLYEPSRGARHALCSADQWLNGLTPGHRGMRSFHPTADGHAATAGLVARRVQRLDWTHLLPDVANTTYPEGACMAREPLVIAGGQSPNAGDSALPDGSDNPQAYDVAGTETTDLDGDRYPDVAARLFCTLGGATGFTDGWAWLSKAASWQRIPRVVSDTDDPWLWPARGFDVHLREGALVVTDYIVQGATGDEAECCPGTTVEAIWRLDGNEFVRDGTPVVTAESSNPLNAFLVGTSLGLDTSIIASQDAVSQAAELDLGGAHIVDRSTCDMGDVTTYCTYPMRRANGSDVTVEVLYGPPDADYVGEGAYSTSEDPVVFSIAAV